MTDLTKSTLTVPVLYFDTFVTFNLSITYLDE